MNYKKILKQSIDLHVHIGPEIIPRKFTLSELIDCERGKLKGVGIKNHFFSTAGMARSSPQDGDPFVVDSVVLNSYVGGFNADIIRASAELSEKPIIVWFPTLNAEAFLRRQKFEIAEEWIDAKVQRTIKLRPAEKIKALFIFDDERKISKEVISVLSAVKENNAILATGHISWRESYELIKYAVETMGIKKIIVTHPIYQKIDMPIEVQKELAGLGALMEQCYSMYSIDKISIDKIAKQIREVGAKNCILSSDVGQTFSKSPSEALADFITLLEVEGITEDEIKIMLIHNPGRLVE